MEEQNTNEQQPVAQPVVNTNASDIERNKAMAIIGYIIPILFFIPLVTDAKDSAFAKFHANQQLILLIVWIIGSVASSILMVILIGFLLYFLLTVAGLVFMVMGIMNAAKGEMKELPIIGSFKIIN